MLQILLTSLYYLSLTVAVIATLGGLAYYLIAIFCAYRLSRRRLPPYDQQQNELPPMSLLKPLCGAEPELEQCLATFFTQDYPEYEILFAVRHPADPAVEVVNRLRQAYPQTPTKMVYTGEPPYANAKIYSLEKMAEAARHELLIITDSDTRVAPDYLKAMAREFAAPDVGAVTNLYRGVNGGDLWSRLEALGMSTDFMAGVVVAERLEGMKFMLGPSMALRRACLKDIGGFGALRDYLADDFVLGNWAEATGWRVALSTYVVNHHVSSVGFLPTFRHRLRWNRSTRFSRPAGYLGQGFTYGSSWALLLWLLFPSFPAGVLLLVTLLLRGWLAAILAVDLLADTTVINRLGLLPLQDLLSFASWLGGFMSREVVWRNERYRLLDGGRFEPVVERTT
jgi:ceramide glucosyltransferase